VPLSQLHVTCSDGHVCMNADIHITEMDVMTRSYVCNNICAFSSEKGIGSFDLLRIPVGRNVASI